MSAGWKVHGVGYPIVWWARRKPESRIRQRAWDVLDAYRWGRLMRSWKRRA